MVGGEARQATVTLSAPTAGETCPLQVAGIPRAIQVAGAPVPALQPAAPPVTPLAPAPPLMVMQRCPAGVSAGQTMMFEHSGRRFKVVVPAGVSPGQEFRVPLPS